MAAFLFFLFYIPFLLICFIAFPAWALFKKKRVGLAVVFAVPSFLGVASIGSYLYEPAENDAGFVVFGMFFIMPMFFCFIQAAIYTVFKVFEIIFRKAEI